MYTALWNFIDCNKHNIQTSMFINSNKYGILQYDRNYRDTFLKKNCYVELRNESTNSGFILSYRELYRFTSFLKNWYQTGNYKNESTIYLTPESPNYYPTKIFVYDATAQNFQLWLIDNSKTLLISLMNEADIYYLIMILDETIRNYFTIQTQLYHMQLHIELNEAVVNEVKTLQLKEAATSSSSSSSFYSPPEEEKVAEDELPKPPQYVYDTEDGETVDIASETSKLSSLDDELSKEDNPNEMPPFLQK